jgi:hypothetical protein
MFGVCVLCGLERRGRLQPPTPFAFGRETGLCSSWQSWVVSTMQLDEVRPRLAGLLSRLPRKLTNTTLFNGLS